MKLGKIFVTIVACTLITSCATMKKDYRDRLRQIKTVGVVLYTVPESVVYRPDPRETLDKNLLTAALELASRGDGKQAATLAHEEFIAELNAKKIGFTALEKSKMLANDQFAKAAKQPEGMKIGGVDVKMVASALSMFQGKKSDDGPPAAGPESMRTFGLSSRGHVFSDNSDEKPFITNAIGSLAVDAAIVVSDPGMSFNCKACVLVPGAGATGAGTTGADYKVAIVAKDGTVLLEYSGWFNSTDAEAAMAASAVNPTQHDSLFKAHGKKIADNFSDYFVRYMSSGS